MNASFYPVTTGRLWQSPRTDPGVADPPRPTLPVRRAIHAVLSFGDP